MFFLTQHPGPVSKLVWRSKNKKGIASLKKDKKLKAILDLTFRLQQLSSPLLMLKMNLFKLHFSTNSSTYCGPMFFAQLFSLHVLQWRKILNVFGWKMLCHGYKSVVNFPVFPAAHFTQTRTASFNSCQNTVLD